MCISFLQINRNQFREREYICRKSLSKNWLTELWRLARVQNLQGRPEVETSGRASVAVQVQRPSSGEFTLCRHLNALFSPLTLSLDETYPHYSLQFALLKVCQFRVNLIQNHPTESTRIIIDKISEHCLVQSRWHNLNHHNLHSNFSLHSS